MSSDRKTPKQKDPQNYSRPQGGLIPVIPPGYEHTEKAAYDQAHGRSGLSKPSSGGHVRPQKLRKPRGLGKHCDN